MWQRVIVQEKLFNVNVLISSYTTNKNESVEPSTLLWINARGGPMKWGFI